MSDGHPQQPLDHFSGTGYPVSTSAGLSRRGSTSAGDCQTLHGNSSRSLRSARQTADVLAVFVAEEGAQCGRQVKLPVARRANLA